MKLPHRRQFLLLAAGAAALPAVSRFAWAQAYPSRPVRMIEGFGAGGAPDIVARLIGQSLSERLGQSFVIENRTGASSNIAAEAVVRASPDGYTLLMITTANAVNTTMFKLNFNFIRDIAPVASIVRVPFVMEVHPSVPVKTVAEFIAYAKANPGKINLASAGTGLCPTWPAKCSRRWPASICFTCLIAVHKYLPVCSPATCRSILVRCSHRSGISGPAICAPWR